MTSHQPITGGIARVATDAPRGQHGAPLGIDQPPNVATQWSKATGTWGGFLLVVDALVIA